MIIIDEITAEHGESTVVRMQAIDFAKLIRDRYEATESAIKVVRAAREDADKMARDLTAERDRHARYATHREAYRRAWVAARRAA